MSNESKLLGVRVPAELYEQVQEHIDGHGVSVSDFVRDAIKQMLNTDEQLSNKMLDGVQQKYNNRLEEENKYLRQQLEQSMLTTQQMQSGLESSKERSDTIILQLTRQLDSLTEQNQLLLEDKRPKRRWYHRLLVWNNA